MREPKLFPVRVMFVYDASRYDVLVTLDFGVYLKKPVRLDGTADFPSGSSCDPRELERFRAAKKLAMSLCLGKQAFAKITETRKHLWAELSIIGSLPRVTEKIVDGEKCFDVAEAVRLADKFNFDVRKLGWDLEVRNGTEADHSQEE